MLNILVVKMCSLQNAMLFSLARGWLWEVAGIEKEYEKVIWGTSKVRDLLRREYSSS